MMAGKRRRTVALRGPGSELVGACLESLVSYVNILNTCIVASLYLDALEGHATQHAVDSVRK